MSGRMLSQYRVLDLCDERGMFCSYLLSHFGAEVIAIEPPGGSSARRLAPFDSIGESLWWQAYTRGKEIRELDFDSPSDQAIFRTLATDADFVIDSFSKTERERLGLDYERLRENNPSLIAVSITPFGSTGPKAAWPATDLTVWASSGAHVLAGDADRAPVRTSVPQSWLHAGADAAGAALIALHARHRDGLGQHVDVSAQQSAAQASLCAMLTSPNGSKHIQQRVAGGQDLAGLPHRLTWPCKGGYITITLMFGHAFREPNRQLFQWLVEKGYCDPDIIEREWLLPELVAAPEPYLELCNSIEKFAGDHTQEELFEEGFVRGIYIAPVLSIEDLLEDRHFREREFWHQIQIGAEQVRVPGRFATLSKTPLRLPDSTGSTPRSAKATLSGSPGPRNDSTPLTGLKVLDFMWVLAGPTFTRVLADYGATVVRVESTTRLDPGRGHPPFRDDEQTLEHGVPFANFNAGKFGITVDPNNPVGREVILDLVRWADVVTESFTPKAMAAWGLDYETLIQVNPNLIMLSSSLMGQTGPRAQMPGYGNMAGAITGFYDLTGWQDRSPAGPYLAYTDGVAPRFMLASLLAALEHRRNTGEGQYIDVSQAESSIHFLSPAILDFEINRHLWQRDGNRDLQMCPHGVFPTRGDDCWIAIACQSDEAWSTFSTMIGLQQDATLATATARKAREDELESLIASWSRDQDGRELEITLIEAGVAAHVVQNSALCDVDPQLAHRNHFVPVIHTSLGEMIVEGTRYKLSRTPARIERAHPELGEHNAEVLLDILGYDADRAADVFAALAME